MNRGEWLLYMRVNRQFGEHLQKVQTVWRALTKSADSQHLSLPACKRLDDDDLARADHIIELELIYLKSESLLRIIT